MKKQGKLMLLSVLIAGSCLIPAIGHQADASDLTALEKFEVLKKNGIFLGLSNNSAGLDQNMNRAQFARVAALMLGLEGIGTPDTKVVTEKPFSDVELDTWYVEEVAAMKEAEMMVGNPDGTFNPTNDMTIQELAVATARILGINPVPDAKVEGAADWAAGYIAALLEQNISLPTNYTESATRSDLVSATYQVDEFLAEERSTEQQRLADAMRSSINEKRQESMLPDKNNSTPTTPTVPVTPIFNFPSSPSTRFQVEQPTALPAGGKVESGTTVSLSLGHAGTIYYTTDGSTPSLTNGRVYNAPIVVNQTMTIKAIGIHEQMVDSNILTLSYTVIVHKSALDLINEASTSGDWKGINANTFTDALVTGVSTSNLAAVVSALKTQATAPWTASTIQTIVNTVLSDIARQEALAAINRAAASHDWTSVGVNTFTSAGITGVTESNLTDITVALNENGSTPRSATQIQGVIDRVVALIQINDYYIHGTGVEPDATTFANAGVMGITLLNLTAVKAQLHSNTPWTVVQIQDIVNRTTIQIQKQSALRQINTAAASRDWYGVSVDTFTILSITGVTESNFTDIAAVLNEDSFVPRSVEQIQKVIDALAALGTINRAANLGYWSDVNVHTFTTAGITGVKESNLTDVTVALEENGSLPRSVEQIQDVINAQVALDTINRAANARDWRDVDVHTFTTAGITGVTAANISNIIVELNKNGSTPRSKVQIQELVDALAALASINDYHAQGTSDEPNEVTFASAGITGVTESNLEIVLTALSSLTSHPWAVETLQVEINLILEMIEQSPAYILGRIDAAAQSNDWTGIALSMFDDIGVTGVTIDNSDLLFETLYAGRNGALTVTTIQSTVNQLIALAAFNIAAASNDWSDITLETFEFIGATGVTESNLDAIITKLQLYNALPWTITSLQATIEAAFEQQPPLERINRASEFNNWTGITVSTFVEAGQIDVTDENLPSIKLLLSYNYIWDLSAAELQTSINAILGAIINSLDDINSASITTNWVLISEDQLSVISGHDIEESEATQIINVLRTFEQRIWTIADLQSEINSVLEGL